MSKVHRQISRAAEQAVTWLWRCDRGLTASEQDAFSQWLAEDSRHGEQLARFRRHWRRLDKLTEWRPEHSGVPNPDLLAPPVRNRFRRVFWPATALSAAAAIAIAWILWVPASNPPQAPRALAIIAKSGGQRILDDGSIIELNRGAEVSVQFSPGERRVQLEQGEAYFQVSKDTTRPFIVTVGGLDVRAVGTAFNVRMDASVVEVMVTEGRVEVNAPNRSGPRDALIPPLDANQRVVVSRNAGGAPPQIANLTRGEIERVLSWQHRLLNFTAAPLSEIVAEFNRRNDVQMVLIDPDLASVRISASFRSDNVEGFVRLLEAGFDALAEPRGDSEILLRKSSRGRQ